MGRPKFDDTKAACNYIQSKRKYSRKIKCKEIGIPLEINDVDTKILAKTICQYNPLTDKYYIAVMQLNVKKLKFIQQ